MIEQTLSFTPSVNWRQQRVHCGVSGEFIEDGERTLCVTCLQHGYVCKPGAVFEAVVAAIRRGEKEKGWEPLDLASALGLKVRLIIISEDCIAVMLNEREIYFQCWAERGYCTFSDARALARGIAAELGTKVIEIDFCGFDGKDAFMIKHGVSAREWDAHYRDAAARWRIPRE